MMDALLNMIFSYILLPQYFGINNQIRSEIEKQLSSLSRKILDEPKTDSMIRSKISDEIDSRIQTRYLIEVV